MSDWISVKKSMPKSRQIVDAFYVCRFTGEKRIFYFVKYTKSNGFDYTDDSSYPRLHPFPDEDITHWAQSRKPPK